MNWTRFGRVLWVVAGIPAFICGMEWWSKASQDGWYMGGTYMPPPDPTGYAALTIVFGIVALIGVAFMLSARQTDDS